MDRDPEQKKSYWSRRASPKGPVIVVNDVTYRSPEEMPEDVRTIWDGHTRQLEQRGVDWREQDRIVLSWAREGNVVRQSIHFEKRGINSQGRGIGLRAHHESRPWTLPKAAWAIYFIGWVLLVLVALSGDARLLVFASDSALPRLSFCLLCAPWMILTVGIFRARSEGRSHLFPDLAESKMKSVAMLATMLLMTYFAAFGGVTALLHYIERKPGEATVTVKAKHIHSSKRLRCIPQLEFEEFRFFRRNLCVDSGLFNLVKVGDSIRIVGRVSRYAIEPYTLEPSNAGSTN